MRKVQFTNGEYYHIYNRGVDKRQIFLNEGDYSKFFKNLKEFNNKSYYEERKREPKELSSFLAGLDKVVEIIAYTLAPNHFHLILKQLIENGISNFMHKVGTSFTNYFNKKYKRSGSLFQGPYKIIHIENDEYFLWLSGYVNGNIEIHQIADAENYRWSSFKGFLGEEKDCLLGDVGVILSQFKNPQNYKKFVKRVIEESRTRKEMEKYLLEDPGKELSSFRDIWRYRSFTG